jgi:hypothetical protein
MRKILLDHEGNLPLICKNCSMKHGDSCMLGCVSPVSADNCGGRYTSTFKNIPVVVEFNRFSEQKDSSAFKELRTLHCSEECADHHRHSRD